MNEGGSVEQHEAEGTSNLNDIYPCHSERRAGTTLRMTRQNDGMI